MHVHACYPLAHFLDHAHANFEGSLGRNPVPQVLALTEARGESAFSRLAEQGARSTRAGGWTLETTGEPGPLRARSGARTLLVLAGRQVAAREDSRCSCSAPRSSSGRASIRELLEAGTRQSALRVIPWGAGKWFLARGKLLSEILRSERPSDFFLGDEGGRPAFWPEPRHFREARERGIRVLPGSDPLPFPREFSKAGSYGARLRGSFDPASPLASLRSLLTTPEVALEPFGRRESTLRFFRNQLAMQVRKRRRRAAGAA